jgi:hypothetical protein
MEGNHFEQLRLRSVQSPSKVDPPRDLSDRLMVSREVLRFSGPSAPTTLTASRWANARFWGKFMEGEAQPLKR